MMVNKITLNGYSINIEKYYEEIEDDLLTISIVFYVNSEHYHDITTLLYSGTFDVVVPERNLSFRGMISNYSTSITNLYEKGNIGEYKLSLKQVNS